MKGERFPLENQNVIRIKDTNYTKKIFKNHEVHAAKRHYRDD